MDMASIIQAISVMALPILLGVTLHEAGHAYAAYYLGDDTAARQGRLSLNPLVHVDPVGTVIMPAMLLLMSAGFVFGYAKPVPVNTGRLRNPRRDSMIVSIAGPAANILVAIAGAISLKIGISLGFTGEDWLLKTSYYIVWFNCLLAVFNLLPVPPLDGGHILMELVPFDVRQRLWKLERFGIFIVLGIVILFPAVIRVPLVFLSDMILLLVGI